MFQRTIIYSDTAKFYRIAKSTCFESYKGIRNGIALHCLAKHIVTTIILDIIAIERFRHHDVERFGRGNAIGSSILRKPVLELRHGAVAIALAARDGSHGDLFRCDKGCRITRAVIRGVGSIKGVINCIHIGGLYRDAIITYTYTRSSILAVLKRKPR